MSIQDDLAPYRTDSLFLLVGQNPLPNYVAASLLLNAGGALYLVHSSGPTGTGKIAERLAAQFPRHTVLSISVDAGDTASIRRAIEGQLEDTPPRVIGLNYTGGTKMMAVHAYAAVAEFCRKRGRRAQFSYLDADGLQLLIEEQPGQPAWRRRVALEVDLSLETLLKLHGIRCTGALRKEPLQPSLARALAHQNSSTAGIQAWQAARKVLQAAEGRLWADVQSELHDTGVSSEVLDGLAAACGLDPGQPFGRRQAAAKAGLKSPEALKLWLESGWLEHWALECIKRCGCQERAQDINCLSPNAMQIDLAALRGYQLFALSCGVTDDLEKAKIKLLEIFTRGRQLGGDEARVAFVGLVEDPDAVQQKLRLEWDAGDRIRVFGRRHLEDLATHLQRWFDSV